MHYTGRKGWQASYKDTWCMKSTLSPIIAAGVRKFIDTIKNNEYGGVPGSDEFLGEIDKENGGYKDFGLAQQKWHEVLEEIFYAFDNPEEPEIPEGLYDKDRAFGIKVITKEQADSPSFWHTKPELYETYTKECEEWEKRRQKGLDLFAKYFDNMWW